MKKTNNITMAADIVLGENGDIAVAIEPPKSRRLAPDYFSFDAKTGNLSLTLTSSTIIMLGNLDPDMINALKKLKSLVLIQLTEDGAAAHAEETPLQIQA